MPLGFSQVEREVKTLLGLISNVIVYSEEVPDDANLPKNANGTIKPYIVTSFGGPYRAARGRGIVNSRLDVNVGALTVRVAAPTYDAARSICDQVMNVLTGWNGTDTGEFVLEGGTNNSAANSQVKPTKYFRDVFYSFRTNLSL